MQLVVQRVTEASVRVDSQVVGAVGPGLVVLVGVGHRSTDDDAAWLARKTLGLRVFADERGHMNRSLDEVGGGVLAISQFTLYGDASKGRRPSFLDAAPPERGEALYHAYCDTLAAAGSEVGAGRTAPVAVARGVFGAHMTIGMVADGPVTLLLRRESGDPDP